MVANASLSIFELAPYFWITVIVSSPILLAIITLILWHYSFSSIINAKPLLFPIAQSELFRSPIAILRLSPLLALFSTVVFVGQTMSYTKQGFLQIAEMLVILFLSVLVLAATKMVVAVILRYETQTLQKRNQELNYCGAAPSLKQKRLTQTQIIAVWATALITMSISIYLCRSWELIYPNQPVFFKIPVFSVFNDLMALLPNLSTYVEIDSDETRQHILNLVEAFVIMILLLLFCRGVLFGVHLFSTTLRLIPGFNIILSASVQLGILITCLLGIVLGYSPILL